MNILPTKEDQRMKKIVALILTCVLLLGLVSAHAEEPGKYDRLNVGVTTPFSGNFLDDALGSNLCDQDVRNLIALGMKPSPEFGRILSALYDAQLDGEFSDLEGGLGYFHRRLEGKETR